MMKESTPEEFEAMEQLALQVDWEGGGDSLIEHGVSRDVIHSLPKEVLDAFDRLDAVYSAYQEKRNALEGLLDMYGVEL